MIKRLMDSELILNSDGSIYHLNLLPEDIADTIILVGDPNRVKQVSKYFDRIDVQKTKREFVAHTGMIGSQRISVVGTGIGAGNIDITISELDALVNIDLKNRVVKDSQRKLRFIRLGTSGSLQHDIPVDHLLISSYGIGSDGLMLYYDWQNNANEKKLLNRCREKFASIPIVNAMYVASGAHELIDLFHKKEIGFLGMTLTCPGFYGAQNRQLRAQLANPEMFTIARELEFENQTITNLEMETAAIYGMARLLGHDACSISAIIANRSTQTFSTDPDKTVDDMIQKVLAVVCESPIEVH
jgi:uridine phosphorylase